jgi:hypothetical protein
MDIGAVMGFFQIKRHMTMIEHFQQIADLFAQTLAVAQAGQRTHERLVHHRHDGGIAWGAIQQAPKVVGCGAIASKEIAGFQRDLQRIAELTVIR